SRGSPPPARSCAEGLFLRASERLRLLRAPVLKLNRRVVVGDDDAIPLREVKLRIAHIHVPRAIVEPNVAAIDNLRCRVTRAHLVRHDRAVFLWAEFWGLRRGRRLTLWRGDNGNH